MTTLIIYSLTLALIQVLLAIVVNIKNLDYLLSSRDESKDESPYTGRSKRAFSNLLESLPIFLTLSILSIILEIDNYNPALYWLILRAIYVPLYIFNVKNIRTLAWMGSIICLVLMAVSLI
jgi:uncharacterized MAPEG superfamily protein